MKVFNLLCSREHPFEGWFASAEAFESQAASGMLECPLCGSREVRKTLSAPRLNLSGTDGPQKKEITVMPSDNATRAALINIARQIAATSEDVGARFVEEARRIHYQEIPQRSIRGLASRDEAAELAEEGIEVMPLPFANLVKDPLQ